ncbi:MAG: hypothetical protein LUF92_00360 [Clostridiales bacterium]|nr:hypothetical protein [Clostridiales bacterium]
MVEKVACFLTCGYMEAGAMQAFLRKMNTAYDFKQYLPNKTIKKKGDPKIINPEISGMTGKKLLDKIYSLCRKYRKDIIQCKAILIEDDLDGRFFKFSEEEIKQYNQAIIDKVHESLEVENIPVILLYASPEIESWFIADWEHGFGCLYNDKSIVDDLNQKAGEFFTYHLKQYIDKKILKEYERDIEEYGWFNGSYIKLSDQIIIAVQTDVKEYIQSLPKVNADYAEQIVNSRKLYYSKKLHGDRMLRRVQPSIIEKKCKRYYKDAYDEIRDL